MPWCVARWTSACAAVKLPSSASTDIDWRAGTVTLRNTKCRREDILPLPEATGRAIADYLSFERPQTTNRSVFVRRVAPRDQPIGPDLVRQEIRQAYARAGLDVTGRTFCATRMASRLLEGGSSLKEVADVLRHRSLNTTLIYAKLDSKIVGGRIALAGVCSMSIVPPRCSRTPTII